MGVNLDTSKGRSQESGVRSQESGVRSQEERRTEERRKKKEENFSIPCSLFSDNSIEFNFVLYGFYQQPVVGLN
ncbi:MAG: hypothetical protein HEP80_00885 [Dolichospermum sp. UKL201]|nr:MAG: hypothetical protein HEP80_00885 [Dolichospermum sp. UKL201]